MSESRPVRKPFDAAHAEIYDTQFERLHAIKDLLHLLLRVQFAGLPADARILLAGAGTGAEARFLAPLFPGWRFTLVDPSEPMLAVARRHAEAEGFADRCTFHVGLVSSLPEAPHHAATSILVSHFLTNADERRAFFGDIAARLLPGGLLFTADLCADRDDASFPPLMALWLGLTAHAGALADDGGEGYRAAFGRDFAAHGPVEVAALIRAAGFSAPVPCAQAALIRGWIATRS